MEAWKELGGGGMEGTEGERSDGGRINNKEQVEQSEERLLTIGESEQSDKRGIEKSEHGVLIVKSDVNECEQ